MKMNYDNHVNQIKSLSDVNRLMIIDMLSCGELCGCEILEKLDITQPTLSHHMKILNECGLVESRKEGKNTYYKLNDLETTNLKDFLNLLFSNTPNCICK